VTASDSIDLSALERSAPPGAPSPPRWRRIWVLIPVLLLLGSAFVLFESASGMFSTAVKVTVVRPSPVQTASAQTGSPILQAAGWVEPDPFSLRVTALAAGVVEELLVQEASRVKTGDPLARLVSTDAELEVAAAQTLLEKARADQQAAQAEYDHATDSFAAALEVTEARDVATADHGTRSAEVALRRAALLEAEATLDVANNELETQRFLLQEGAVGPWQVELAQARCDEVRARLSGLEAELLRAQAIEEQSEARLQRSMEDFELRLEERRRIAVAKAGLASAEAEIRTREVVLREATLQLDRMTVLSPTDGVVLTRDALVGSVVGPQPTALPICHLYDPTSLRVRVDVPQGQVIAASVDMRAEIRCDVQRERVYEGRVLRLVEKADIQKVTLEVQVRVIDPDDALKPDMLCQVTVFGSRDSVSEAPTTIAVRIPTRCIDAGDLVWVVDGETWCAHRRELEVGGQQGENSIVLEGLNATDKVIDRGREELREGDRVQVEGSQ
jgi:HlyD family secretion protein